MSPLGVVIEDSMVSSLESALNFHVSYDFISIVSPSLSNSVTELMVNTFPSADGKVLTINSVTLFERDGETMEMKSYETWKLSADSNELTMESSITTPNGDMKSTCVYD